MLRLFYLILGSFFCVSLGIHSSVSLRGRDNPLQESMALAGDDFLKGVKDVQSQIKSADLPSVTAGLQNAIVGGLMGARGAVVNKAADTMRQAQSGLEDSGVLKSDTLAAEGETADAGNHPAVLPASNEDADGFLKPPTGGVVDEQAMSETFRPFKVSPGRAGSGVGEAPQDNSPMGMLVPQLPEGPVPGAQDPNVKVETYNNYDASPIPQGFPKNYNPGYVDEDVLTPPTWGAGGAMPGMQGNLEPQVGKEVNGIPPEMQGGWVPGMQGGLPGMQGGRVPGAHEMQGGMQGGFEGRAPPNVPNGIEGTIGDNPWFESRG